jgi:hypothetical protein
LSNQRSHGAPGQPRKAEKLGCSKRCRSLGASRSLVWIWSTRTDRDKTFYSLPDFIETRQSCRTLDGMGAYANLSFGLWQRRFGGEPKLIGQDSILISCAPSYG